MLAACDKIRATLAEFVCALRSGWLGEYLEVEMHLTEEEKAARIEKEQREALNSGADDALNAALAELGDSSDEDESEEKDDEDDMYADFDDDDEEEDGSYI